VKVLLIIIAVIMVRLISKEHSMTCKYYNKNQCRLILEWQPKRFIDERFCLQTCGENGPDEETKRLLIEWAKAKQAAETAMKSLREHKQQKLLDEMPKGFQLAKNLMGHLRQIHKHYKETGRIKVDKEEYERRIEICKHCPDDKLFLKPNGAMLCGKCGCHLNHINAVPGLGGKAEYEALHCDLGRW